jgi:hypothetical protein
MCAETSLLRGFRQVGQVGKKILLTHETWWVVATSVDVTKFSRNDLCSSANIVRVMKSRRMGWSGHVTRMEESRGVYRVLVGKPEGNRPLSRPRRRWENIIMEL